MSTINSKYLIEYVAGTTPQEHAASLKGGGPLKVSAANWLAQALPLVHVKDHGAWNEIQLHAVEYVVLGALDCDASLRELNLLWHWHWLDDCRAGIIGP